ncbi:MAG: ATP-binding protein [Tenuifilaceae bacterium]
MSEKGLKKENENLLDILNSMPSLIFAVNRNGEIVFWNKLCEDVTGYKSNEIIENKEAFKLILPASESRKNFKHQIKDKSNSKSKLETKLVSKKGETKFISWTFYKDSYQIKDWATVAVGVDSTNQKNSELLQKKQIKNLEALAKVATDYVGLPISDSIYHYLGTKLEFYIPGPIYTIVSLDSEKNALNVEGVYGVNLKSWSRILDLLGWNPVGRRFQVNDSFIDNYKKGKLIKIDKSLYEFSEGNLSSKVSRIVEKFIDLKDIYVIGLVKDEQCFGGVLVFIKEDIDVDYSLLEGIIDQASVTLYRRELENQLLAAKEKAEESDRLKSAFLANMSHEIRTPMNAIIGFSQLMGLPNLTSDKRKRFIEIINSKGNILVKLINDIIDASKVEAGQLTVVYAPFNINNLLRNMLRFYKKEKVFQKREALEIKLVIPDGTDFLELVTDEGRLEQVLTNLISNALKFTERGSIEFGYKTDNNNITFFVKDTGVGIDPQMQTLIFERFRQVDDNTSKKFGGTGLGLSISKGIVNLLGGKIWVESEIGAGTTFYFNLPYRILPSEDINKEIEVIENQEHLPDWRNKVILIAEDEEVNYIFLNELLSITGVTLLWAKDGGQAVELVNTIKKIDLILMDIKMPVMNGYAATMEIRQINPKLPVVAQTAYAFSEDRQKAESAGCNDYITKPINDKELFGILEKYLGS